MAQGRGGEVGERGDCLRKIRYKQIERKESERKTCKRANRRGQLQV